MSWVSATTSSPIEQCNALTAAQPRSDFKNRIPHAFAEGNAHRPRTTFGNVNADVLAHYLVGFGRDDFVEIIFDNSWPD